MALFARLLSPRRQHQPMYPLNPAGDSALNAVRRLLSEGVTTLTVSTEPEQALRWDEAGIQPSLDLRLTLLGMGWTTNDGKAGDL